MCVRSSTRACEQATFVLLRKLGWTKDRGRNEAGVAGEHLSDSLLARKAVRLMLPIAKDIPPYFFRGLL